MSKIGRSQIQNTATRALKFLAQKKIIKTDEL